MIDWESVYNLESYMEEIGLYEQAKGKKLLIIGGETNIANIVNEAKKMGVYTIVTERDGGTPLPAKLIADEAWDVDYTDMDTLSRMCREAGVSGVMSGYSEGKVLCAAKLAQRIGTPFYVTPEQVEITRDKRSFKDLCVKYDVPVVKDLATPVVKTSNTAKGIKLTWEKVENANSYIVYKRTYNESTKKYCALKDALIDPSEKVLTRLCSLFGNENVILK